jgi:hypothetical protein
MNAEGVVLEEFDSWAKTAVEFITEIVKAAITHNVLLIAVEDIPYGLSKQFMIKPPLRLQGALIYALNCEEPEHKLLSKTVFVNPATWQRSYEGVYRGKEAGALAAAARLDYTPPNMLEIHDSEIPASGKERAKVRGQLKKASTDYVDAFLIARYVLAFSDVENASSQSGIQRPTI